MNLFDVKTCDDIYIMIGGACWCEATTEGKTSEGHRRDKEKWIKIRTEYNEGLLKIPSIDGQSWGVMQQKIEPFLRLQIANYFLEDLEDLLCTTMPNYPQRPDKDKINVMVKNWILHGE